MSEVKIENLSKSFGPVEVLKDIDLTIKNGSFVVLVGPSGCGKSTLLRTIAGLETVSGGAIRIAGAQVNDLAPAARGIAMVFQSYALYPHMDVYGNMAFGLKFAGMPKPEIDRRVNEAARILKLEALMKRRPRELSGGQRQRVAIGRAIVREPKVFLFDEPLSNLDAALRVNTRIEIAKLHKMLKATIVYVTHDQVEAMTLADKIVVMNKGRIEQAGKPLDLYYKPANMFVAGFIGSPAMNFIEGEIAEVTDRGYSVRLGDDASVSFTGNGVKKGHKVTLGVRPEHLDLSGKGDLKLEGRIDIVERLGETGYAHISTGSGRPIIAEVRGGKTGEPGQAVTLSATLGHTHLFDEAGQRIG
jgi:ABC-type sugar transport system ATPase subunit